MIDLRIIKMVDEVLYESMIQELHRQQNNLELIASENLVSPAVMAAQGSFLTNKYAEGYPGHRYYGGCEFDTGYDGDCGRLQDHRRRGGHLQNRQGIHRRGQGLHRIALQPEIHHGLRQQHHQHLQRLHGRP